MTKIKIILLCLKKTTFTYGKIALVSSCVHLSNYVVFPDLADSSLTKRMTDNAKYEISRRKPLKFWKVGTLVGEL